MAKTRLSNTEKAARELLTAQKSARLAELAELENLTDEQGAEMESLELELNPTESTKERKERAKSNSPRVAHNGQGRADFDKVVAQLFTAKTAAIVARQTPSYPAIDGYTVTDSSVTGLKIVAYRTETRELSGKVETVVYRLQNFATVTEEFPTQRFTVNLSNGQTETEELL